MIKLLLVDDERALLSGLKQCIPWESIGIGDVFAEFDPCTALELALSIKPNIVITDINMPRMNGIELATAIRKFLPDCGIIFLTAFSEKEFWKKAIVLRAANFLEKPVDRAELLNAVSAVVKDIESALVKSDNLARKENIVHRLSTMSTKESKKQVIEDVNMEVYNETIQQIKNIIDENYMNADLNLDMISRRAHLSPQYICRIFKQHSGQTVNSFIISTRIDKAKQLLENQGIRVSEIARMVGYLSPNHFAKVFNSQVGMNPSVYRKMIYLHEQL